MDGAKRYPSIAVCEDDGFREAHNPSCRTADRAADLPDGLFGRSPVQPHLQKYFHFRLTQISCLIESGSALESWDAHA
jgi:hypothetical protein